MENEITRYKYRISLHAIKIGILIFFFTTATISLSSMLYIRLYMIPYEISHKISVPIWMHGMGMQIIWLIWAFSSVTVVITLLSVLVGNSRGGKQLE